MVLLWDFICRRDLLQPILRLREPRLACNRAIQTWGTRFFHTEVITRAERRCNTIGKGNTTNEKHARVLKYFAGHRA